MKQKLFFLILSALLNFCVIEKLSAISSTDVNYFPETSEMDRYLNSMPWNLYKSYFVKNLGWFWVDKARDVVKDEIKAGRIWEPYIINIISKHVKDGDFVVDIGAHMGTITIAMSNIVGPKGKVFSFEGERQFFRELVHNLYSNDKKNVFPHLCWIGNENKDILTDSNYGTYSPVSLTSSGIWSLPKRTLDSFNFSNIALMKIDVECTEDAVLEGAYTTIMNSRPVIVIEIMGGYGFNPTKQTLDRIKNTISILNSMNYTVSLIHIDDYLAIPNEKL